MEFVVLFMVILLAIIFLKIKRQVDQINLLNKYLYIQKRPDKYVEQMDTILSRKLSPKNIIINNIQKSTGLFYEGKFQEVIDLTNEIKKMPKNWEPIYYQNIILSLLFIGETEKAVDTFEKANTIFEEYEKNNYYKEFIDIVKNVVDFYKGNASKNYFAELAKSGANDYRKSFGYYFLGKINKKENNISATKANFNNAMEYGKGSFIEEFSKAE
ncbi:MAG: hypothetical protein WBJ13_10305 [Sedimentibacter sp.]